VSGRLTDSNLEQLQKSKVFTEKPATTATTQLLYNVLPFVVVIGLLYFLFVRQLKNAGKGALSFGKSRAKMLTREKDRINFSDVAGCDEAKEEVSEVVDFLKDPKKFQKIGGRIPKGILMVGPRAPARRCSRRPSPARPTCRSSPSAARTLLKCSSASARAACATCSNRAARTRPA